MVRWCCVWQFLSHRGQMKEERSFTSCNAKGKVFRQSAQTQQQFRSATPETSSYARREAATGEDALFITPFRAEEPLTPEVCAYTYPHHRHTLFETQCVKSERILRWAGFSWALKQLDISLLRSRMTQLALNDSWRISKHKFGFVLGLTR